MKVVFQSLLLFLVSEIFLCQECTTPLDCYLKAYEQIQKDREEMRDLKTKLEAMVNTKVKNIEDRAFSMISNLTGQIKTDVQLQIDTYVNRTGSQISEMNSSIGKVYNTVDILKVERQNRHFMYKDSIIHDDIFNALEKGVILKMGNPSGWDDTSYRTNLWNGRKMLRIGVNFQTNENGLSTVVPDGFNMVWLRVSNHIWQIFRLNFLDGQKEEVGKFTCGKRSLNEISPDGAAPDTNGDTHIWCNMPVGRSGQIAIYTDRFTEGWISGIAFGKNLWNHARNGALAYHWSVNGGHGVFWEGDNWNGDTLAKIPGGAVAELIVPVVYSGKDKLLYLIEHNNNWLGTMHTNIFVNGTSIERFRTSYQNPFATHYNSKIYQRYIAAKIPKEMITPETKFINVKIDMTSLNDNLNMYFREVGTHDYFY